MGIDIPTVKKKRAAEPLKSPLEGLVRLSPKVSFIPIRGVYWITQETLIIYSGRFCSDTVAPMSSLLLHRTDLRHPAFRLVVKS